jgi:heme-degrading monooxygenase HmoA
MILEVAQLSIKAGQESAFVDAMHRAAPLLTVSAGYLGHEIQQCVETPTRFMLFVRWHTLDAHMEGFRKSERLTEWRAILTPFYDAPAIVEHYEVRASFPSPAAE